jgi:hypothetical protein
MGDWHGRECVLTGVGARREPSHLAAMACTDSRPCGVLGLRAHWDFLLGWFGYAGSGELEATVSSVLASCLAEVSGVSSRRRLCMAGVREALRLMI